MTSESVLHLFCTPASRSFVRVVRVGAASRAVGTCDGVRGHGRRTRPRPAYWLLPPFIFFSRLTTYGLLAIRYLN